MAKIFQMTIHHRSVDNDGACRGWTWKWTTASTEWIVCACVSSMATSECSRLWKSTREPSDFWGGLSKNQRWTHKIYTFLLTMSVLVALFSVPSKKRVSRHRCAFFKATTNSSVFTSGVKFWASRTIISLRKASRKTSLSWRKRSTGRHTYNDKILRLASEASTGEDADGRRSQSCLVLSYMYWPTLQWSQTVRDGAHGLV